MWTIIKLLEQIDLWWKKWPIYRYFTCLHEIEWKKQDIQIQAIRLKSIKERWEIYKNYQKKALI